MLIWIFLFFLWRPIMMTETFHNCNQPNCLLIQCYLPINEFIQAAENVLRPFEKFIERQHIFISYHLCTDLTVEKIDEAGACLYGVLFRLFQYDANMTLHERIFIQPSEIQDETIAIIMDMISKVLYRIEYVNDQNELIDHLNNVQDEEIVVINAQSLLPRVHLKISQIILNYGQWFTFIYDTNKSTEMNTCLYEIYSSDERTRISECADENTIHIQLEEHLRNRTVLVESYNDLTSLNTFPRLLPSIYFITDDRSKSSTDQLIKMIDVDISKFSPNEIEQHVILRGPYPFCLFWSAKRKRLERLGDRPSKVLLTELFQREEESIENRRNIHGMIDDEVRYIADQQVDQWTINPHVIFLKQTKDFDDFTRNETISAVLFTVKWDSTSKLARQSFHQIAESLLTFEQFNLLDVDCYDWTEICEREMIDEWPILIVKDRRGEKHVYSGSTDPNQILTFIIRSALIQPYHLNEKSDLKSIEMLLEYQPVIITAYLERGNESLLSAFRNLCVTFVNDETFFFIYQYSNDRSSITVKQTYGDLQSSFQPKYTVLQFDNNLIELKTLLTDLRRPRMMPFLPWSWLESTVTSTIFLAASQSQLSAMKKSIFLDQASLWIDTNSPWIQLLHHYGEIQYPAWIYLDLEKGLVYVNTDLETMDIWLKSIHNQSMDPFYRLASAEVIEKPTQQPIDFSKSMNDEALMNEYKMIQETSQRINEHGLGFDSNGLPIEMNI